MLKGELFSSFVVAIHIFYGLFLVLLLISYRRSNIINMYFTIAITVYFFYFRFLFAQTFLIVTIEGVKKTFYKCLASPDHHSFD